MLTPFGPFLTTRVCKLFGGTICPQENVVSLSDGTEGYSWVVTSEIYSQDTGEIGTVRMDKSLAYRRHRPTSEHDCTGNLDNFLEVRCRI